MQDIRKPYTRSRSNNDLQSRVEQFESARYSKSVAEEDESVKIPVKRVRRDIQDMDMYPQRRKDGAPSEEDRYEDFEEVSSSRRALHTNYSKKRISLSTILTSIIVIGLLAGVAMYTFVFNSATITIVPKYKDINDLGRVFTFVKEKESGVGISFIVETANLSKSKTLTLSETRKVEAKATGKIIVYNNYDTAPQKLIKNTRFLSSTGKMYRISQSIEVPGKRGQVPGSIEVTVYADSNGSDYNSASTNFTIPGFKGTPREAAFYAKSSGPLTGGNSGTMSLVALSDLNAAKDSLMLELDKEIKLETQKMKKEGYTGMYTAIEITYDDNQDEVLRGATGVYTITATGHLILADSSKLAEAVGKTLSDYKDEPARLAYGETLVFTRKQSDKVASTTMFSILVEGKPRVIWVSDIEGIKEMVKGKSRDEFKPLMKTIDSIESAEINFSPLWLSSFPSETNKIVVTESLPKR